jgi:hypothetical protein
MALLERHAAYDYRASSGDWVFVGALTLLAMAIAAVPFVIVGWTISAVRQYVS